MILLLAARALVGLVPFAWWRGGLGHPGTTGPQALDEARLLAGHVIRAAVRLGLPLKCLPRAMALSWMLRRRRIAHRLVMAARPRSGRDAAADALHAWVQCGGETILGELDGPWMEVFAAPAGK